MRVVVDANIVIAAVLRAATTRKLLLDTRLSLCAPAHSASEIEAVLSSPRLHRTLGGLSRQDVRFVLQEVSRRIAIIPSQAFAEHLPEALQLAPHPEDAPYLALALTLDLPLWSNDVDLARQSAVTVYTTQEILDLLR